MGRYTAGFDGPNNPLHRERWAKRTPGGRLPPPTIEGVRRGIVVTEHFIGGAWVGRTKAPLTLPRVRFIERDGE